MVTSNVKKTESATVVDEELLTEVPEQASSKDATVTAIKRSDEETFGDETAVGGRLHSIVKKAKSIATNKQVIGGAIATALLTAGVFVIRKRNSVVEDETTEEQAAA